MYALQQQPPPGVDMALLLLDPIFGDVIGEVEDGLVLLPQAEEEKERFVVDTLDKAMWAARKLRAVREQQDAVKASAKARIDMYKARIAELQAWVDGEIAALEPDAVFFEGLLEGYARRVKEADPDKKTVKLPDATLQLRKQQDAYEKNDDELLTWAEGTGLPDLVKVEKTAAWGTIKESLTVNEAGEVICTLTGEVLPNVKFVPGTDKFSVKVATK